MYPLSDQRFVEIHATPKIRIASDNHTAFVYVWWAYTPAKILSCLVTMQPQRVDGLGHHVSKLIVPVRSFHVLQRRDFKRILTAGHVRMLQNLDERPLRTVTFLGESARDVSTAAAQKIVAAERLLPPLPRVVVTQTYAPLAGVKYIRLERADGGVARFRELMARARNISRRRQQHFFEFWQIKIYGSLQQTLSSLRSLTESLLVDASTAHPHRFSYGTRSAPGGLIWRLRTDNFSEIVRGLAKEIKSLVIGTAHEGAFIPRESAERFDAWTVYELNYDWLDSLGEKVIELARAAMKELRLRYTADSPMYQ